MITIADMRTSFLVPLWGASLVGMRNATNPARSYQHQAYLHVRHLSRHVRALQRVLYRCARQDRDRRFHALYDKAARSGVLWKAWGEVRANRGAAGVDGVSIDDVVRSGVGRLS